MLSRPTAGLACFMNLCVIESESYILHFTCQRFCSARAEVFISKLVTTIAVTYNYRTLEGLGFGAGEICPQYFVNQNFEILQCFQGI
jgi:hypothetical protein